MEYKLRCTCVKDNVKALKTECSSMDHIIYFWLLANAIIPHMVLRGILNVVSRHARRCDITCTWIMVHLLYSSWCDDVDACVRVCSAEGVFPRRNLEKWGGDWSGGGTLILNICHLNWWQICHLNWSCMLSLCLTALSQLHGQMKPWLSKRVSDACRWNAQMLTVEMHYMKCTDADGCRCSGCTGADSGCLVMKWYEARSVVRTQTCFLRYNVKRT